MGSRKPVIHGRDHLPGGADPIPLQATDTGSGGFTTYQDAVLAQSSLWEYWPADETSGNLVGRVGGRLLVPAGTVTYGSAGPFPSIPASTAVHLNGTTGYFDCTLSGGDIAFFAGKFTVIGWWYQDSTAAAALFSAYSGIPADPNEANVYTPVSNYLYFGRRAVTGTTTTPMSPAGWHVVAYTYGGPATTGGTGVGKLWLDAAQIQTLTESDTTGAVNFRLGVQGSPVGNFFNGRVCQVALFSDDLSSLIPTISGTGDAPDALEGKFLMAVGDGTTSWEYPLEVTF